VHLRANILAVNRQRRRRTHTFRRTAAMSTYMRYALYYEHATKDDAERLIADIRRASRAPAQARVVRDQNRRGRTDIPRAGEGDLKVALLVGPLFLLNAFEILQY
jgi:hypothetical protein